MSQKTNYSGDSADRLGWMLPCLLLLAYSILLRIPSLRSDSPVHTDSPAFLQVVALLRGEWAGAVAPFRIEYPVYPYLIFVINHFVPDWLLAAKWAAFLPSLLVPSIVFGATLVLSRDRFAAVFAGFLAASSPTLLLIGASPLYDSLFIFVFALFIGVCLLFIRKPSWTSVVLVGVVMGLCWASRGLGLFLIVPFLTAAFVIPGISIRRKWYLGLAGLALLFVTASLIRLPAKMAAGQLPSDPTNCFKAVIVDGIRYADGDRDSVEYRLNSSATAFAEDEAGICRLPWGQFSSRYFKDQLRAFAVNLKRIVLSDLVTLIAPFSVLFVPLTLGAGRMFNKTLSPAALFLAASCVSFLVLVPAIQYQDRYLFPLVVPFSIVAGIGCAELLRKNRPCRWVLLLLMVIAFLGAIDGFRHTAVRDQAEANYRKACEWIIAQNGEQFTFGVMERHHGVYAYLKRGLVMLPVDEPTRVRIYAGHMNVKYVLAGPDERRHNPAFLNDSAFSKSVVEFGAGSELVQILEMIPPGQ